MKKYVCPELLILLLLAVFLSGFTALERQQQRISDCMIRLHVVANSDSKEDQDVKLQVRDAVLSCAEEITKNAGSVQEAKTALISNLEQLESAANDTLCKLSSTDSATVTLQRELFDVRDYDTFSLPGGYYDALRVTIGAGEGKNWWCVVYPQICTAAATEDQRIVAAMAGMHEDDFALISMESEGYVFRFKLLELFEEMMGKLRPLLSVES